MSWRRLRLLALGLGLVAGAVLPSAARAQRTPPDSTVVPLPRQPGTPADSAAQPDTGGVRDSVMTPLARAPRPASLGVGGGYVWDRDALFSTGASSLLDLLERVPGVTAFRTGWLVTPEHATYGGAFGRVRVFYDGVELDALHPRTGGLPDLSRLEIWTLEEVAVERAAGELRVHLRSWRALRTTPYTRTDVATGELETNLFRGFFGRRFRRGEVVQIGFQQYATQEPQFGGDGDQLALFGRVGWAGGPWSVDATAQRGTRFQSTQRRRFADVAELPELETTAQFAYLRGAYRDPSDAGVWAQLVASTQSLAEASAWHGPVGELTPADSADTTRTRVQYVASAGWNRGALSLTGTARVRAYEGEQVFSPSLRAVYGRGWVEAQLFAERAGEDSTTRLDAEVRLTPLANVAATAAVSRYTPDGETGRAAATAARAELGVRVGRTWLVGGALTRRGDRSGAPVVFDPEFASVDVGTVTGVYGGVRGPVWQDVSAEVVATQWTGGDAAAAYRPEQQVRAQLTLDTRWLRRFPTGEFGFKASGSIEHRAGVLFPDRATGALATVPSTIVNGQVEIRIQDAIAFVQARNALAVQYELVPGYLMPRNLLIYGVRWQFWN